MANLCADLVANRIKTATSSLLWEYEVKGKPLVQVEDLSIVTNWNGAPICVIETIEVRIKPFNEADEAFVYDYGEGDRSLNWWHENMWEYYSEESRSLGRTRPEHHSKQRLSVNPAREPFHAILLQEDSAKA